MGKKKDKAKKKEEKKAKKARKKEIEKSSSPLEKSPKELKSPSEVNKEDNSQSEVTKPSSLPELEKEKKGSMNLSITPTNKKKLKDMAQSVNMSASELIAYWINNQEE
ncbi:hypothetical protein VXN63_06365 [Marinilactibacillus sp. XAAS-LB27]|uniref:hypothetical protein n=1 Tax=Marinilactibacillus sp. XAAS-LB27 TaxID=3114538 RepID=UPI002E18FB32|nr:hypothetical protein [Marinilactibacillus sp. XAAS-LB27]